MFQADLETSIFFIGDFPANPYLNKLYKYLVLFIRIEILKYFIYFLYNVSNEFRQFLSKFIKDL